MFLSEFFPRYVEYGFTATMEEHLDDIAAGAAEWRKIMRLFWGDFERAGAGVDALKSADITEKIERVFLPHLFASEEGRACPACNQGRLSLRFGRFGAFIACSNYPECKYTRELERGGASGSDMESAGLGESAGGEKIVLKNGKYGAYLEAGGKKASLPKNISPDSLDEPKARYLLSLPAVLGRDGGEDVKVGIGRFGPYVQKGKVFKSIPARVDIFRLDLAAALGLLAGAEKKAAAAKEIGPHPKDNQPILLSSGRFGPYLRWGKIMVSLPKALKDDLESLSLQKAIELVNEKAAKTGTLIGTKTKKAKPAKAKKP